MPEPLPVPHRSQLIDGYCLPACVEMVLAYQGVERKQTTLAADMRVTPGVGVPGSRVLRLASRRLEVTYHEGIPQDLENALAAGLPPIALVYTGELPYWSIATPHAVVVTGLDEQSIWLNDPAWQQANIQVPLDEFQLAWDVMSNLYAILKAI